VEWLRNPEYRTLEGIARDQTLSTEEKHVLNGIHKRHMTLAKEPSEKDHQFITQCYEKCNT